MIGGIRRFGLFGDPVREGWRSTCSDGDRRRSLRVGAGSSEPHRVGTSQVRIGPVVREDRGQAAANPDFAPIEGEPKIVANMRYSTIWERLSRSTWKTTPVESSAFHLDETEIETSYRAVGPDPTLDDDGRALERTGRLERFTMGFAVRGEGSKGARSQSSRRVDGFRGRDGSRRRHERFVVEWSATSGRLGSDGGVAFRSWYSVFAEIA